MIQLRGVVKSSQIARSRLQTGISSEQVASFQQFVTQTLQTVEQTCAEARISPQQLPTPSRKAYDFLKQINLEQLPVIQTNTALPVAKTLTLRNLRVQQQALLEKMSACSKSSINAAKTKELLTTLEQTVKEIEYLCARHQVTPVNLAQPSRQVYNWMKFLAQPQNLQLHLTAIQRTSQIATKIGFSPDKRRKQHVKRSGPVVVQFSNISALYKSKSSPQSTLIEVNEGFINASEEVLAAVIQAVFWGKDASTTRIIRDFALSEEFSGVLLEMDLISEVRSECPQGKCYDLEQVFQQVNQSYFAGQMSKPRLAWSQIFTVRKFAHYEPSRDRVIVSLTLDDQQVPPFVVQFVMYHELLHKRHGQKWVNERLMVHTREFRQDERKFERYQEAETWLRQLAKS